MGSPVGAPLHASSMVPGGPRRLGTRSSGDPRGLNRLGIVAEALLFISLIRKPDLLTTQVDSGVGSSRAPVSKR